MHSLKSHNRLTSGIDSGKFNKDKDGKNNVVCNLNKLVYDKLVQISTRGGQNASFLNFCDSYVLLGIKMTFIM